ncbi:unnamed protein product [Lathyrus oleraceus]|uniref:Uncharacterized protein n=1 Tax=Pisum sativum TaxID=3888 RepID=A0A9D4XTX3_PEA|nr:uncharacterized protein LOC127126196 [Pisum sativum]XP_050911039.1 uncharacterized protein LOC127126196 [Pisum sativum]KAI5426797.1 hypothetical protein KIW84_032286 [Pisum sativum]
MQQRKSALGRPSGTDGSDYSYRMVVDSRYQLVAKGKKRLSVLFIIEALFLLIGVLFAVLRGEKDNTTNTVAISSLIASVVLLIIADIGRRRSRSSFLRLYAVLSSLAMLLFTASLANQYSLLKVIQYFGNRGTTSFGTDFPSLETGLLVYILAFSLFKISIIQAVVFLLFNMTPPKKAS